MIHFFVLCNFEKMKIYKFRVLYFLELNMFLRSETKQGELRSKSQIGSAKLAIFGKAEFEILWGSNKILGLFHLT